MDHCDSTTPSSSSTTQQQEASSLKKRFLKGAKEQRSRLYILKRCIIMLLCWQKSSAMHQIINHVACIFNFL
ncbi:hypothetical protein RIF29_40716 [Crotalaria pallida]|uniref:Uncharacterized protein n=1 Tax=Crotalaria pallida TaxID=3830 RepID=A0AAN9E3L6_CROPI